MFTETPILRKVEYFDFLQELCLKYDAYIAGSAALYMCHENEHLDYTDIDIFFEDNGDIFSKCFDNFEKFKKDLISNGLIVFKETEYSIYFDLSDNKKLNLIRPEKFGGYSWYILNNFDIGCCMYTITSKAFYNAEYTSPDSMKTLLKHLNRPMNTLRRVIKYGSRGFQFENLNDLYQAIIDLPNVDDNWMYL